WRGVVRQLLAQGLLAVHGDGYGTLVLTEASAAVLSGTREVRLRREVARPTRSARRAAPSDLPAAASSLFERLRAWRASTARALGAPAYVVFADATLRGIALTEPSTLDELATVSGVGAAKLEKFGDAVLAIVRGDEPPAPALAASPSAESAAAPAASAGRAPIASPAYPPDDDIPYDDIPPEEWIL
ncbi:MAG: ATP-dependent DNA helicase RecQ, partial [Microbacterium sp.]|nr:ATP-dependent DNA helicase RecQ [Microbacterium sp.]